MAADEQFDGFSHETLPSVDLDFSCKNSNESTQPEVIVDVWNHERCKWVRMPTTKVETRVNKDGPADVSRTSRVDVPVTWGRSENNDGKAQLYEYVGVSEGQESSVFDLGRVYFWNQYNEQYSIQQFGYIASIGPSGDDGVFRFYVYDTADLMKNIAVTKQYDEPDAAQVARFVINDNTYGINENSPIPVRTFQTTAPFENIEITGAVSSFDEGVEGWASENIPFVETNNDQGGITGALTDATDSLFEGIDDALGTGGKKHFTRNKHTLVDVMNWLTDKIGGAWYFRPTDTGVILTINNAGTDDFKIARNSYYDGQFNPNNFEYVKGFNAERVNILNNSSLEDLKPINYLELNGESADSFLGSGTVDIGPFEDITNIDRNILSGPLGAPRGHTDKYPHIEVRYPPLLERVNGRKIGPKPIESGKTTLEEAKKAAEKKFLQKHEDNTDGSIEIRALPTIKPYDYIAAVPVCNDTFNANMNPIQYEVNSVVHKVSGNTDYTTVLGVSLSIDESQLEITDTYLSVEGDTSTEGGSGNGNIIEQFRDDDVCDPPA